MRQIAGDLGCDYTNLYKEAFDVSARMHLTRLQLIVFLCDSVCSPKASIVTNGVSKDTGLVQLRYVEDHLNIEVALISKCAVLSHPFFSRTDPFPL